MQKKKRKPDAAAGKFCIMISVFCLSVAAFSSLSPGQRLYAVSTGLMAFSWGSKELAAVKKWKQKLEDQRKAMSVEDRLESERLEKMEKSFSMSNLSVLLAWLVLAIAVLALLGLVFVTLFHYEGVTLIQHDPYLPKLLPPAKN